MALGTSHIAAADAIDPHLAAKLRKEHEALRAASLNVQGKRRIWRSKTVIPEALEKLPDQLDIPFISSESLWLWRSENRFRSDSTSVVQQNGKDHEAQNSFAVDGDMIYHLVGGAYTDTGMLTVLKADTAEGAKYMDSLRMLYYAPIDSLWCLNDGKTPVLDLLQRPNAVFGPSELFPGGYSLSISVSDGYKRQIDFEASRNHPVGRILGVQESDDISVRIERRIFSKEKDGVVLPVRVVDVVSFGPDRGYTNSEMLELEPLQANSPVSRPITPESFRDRGFEYHVYDVDAAGKGKLGKKYRLPAVNMPAADGMPAANRGIRGLVLWVNGGVILAITCYLTYRYLRSRSR